MNDLVTSSIERQNILNNQLAVKEMQHSLQLPGMLFQNEYRYTKKMAAEFYEVDISTIDRYLITHADELKHNGYTLIKGKSLKEFKLQFGHLIDKVSKTTQIGLFNFRSFLNIGMLLSESEKARMVRSTILDIVIDVINSRSGGGTKFINRRDEHFLPAAISEANYRKSFASAIGSCVQGHPTMKYAQATDFIYKAVFKENARQYREILRLNAGDSVKETLYSEVLMLIASFENGVGAEIRKEYVARGKKKLTLDDVRLIVNAQAHHPMMSPYLTDARSKMASRDLGFRNAYHGNLGEYLRSVTPEEFERFIGQKSIDFDSLLEENADILKRLKQDNSDE